MSAIAARHATATSSFFNMEPRGAGKVAYEERGDVNNVARDIIRKMRVLLKFLVFVVVTAAVLLGGAWVWAGRQAGPTIEIRQPGKFLGRTGTVELMLEAPGGVFSAVNVGVEQGGK